MSEANDNATQIARAIVADYEQRWERMLLGSPISDFAKIIRDSISSSDFKEKLLTQAKVTEVLTELAQRFDVYASDQIACKRFGGASHKRLCDKLAETYTNVAQEIRDTIATVTYD
jgi:hypothetical protein